MKSIACVLTTMALGGMIGQSTQPENVQPPKKTITYSELQQAAVIGRLGVRLGTCASNRAVVVSGDSLPFKDYSGRYVLRVLDVDGRALAEPEVFSYSRAPDFSKLPTDHFDHSQLVHGKPAGSLTSEEAANLQ